MLSVTAGDESANVDVLFSGALDVTFNDWKAESVMGGGREDVFGISGDGEANGTSKSTIDVGVWDLIIIVVDDDSDPGS